ncbi:MAG TPA: S53 family peptidase [Bryobacteraceae bacterium]|jgi:subtilase family serine protease|nr:S53 family peptidase [Bryobacteraceae bacterium]
MSNFFYKNSLLLWTVCFFPLPGCAPTALAQSPRTAPPDRPRIVKPIDPNALVTLAGNTRPEANAENDLGKLPDAFALDHMFLQLQRSPEREEALHDFMDQQYDSRSPNFHKWLTAAEFGRLYGSASEDIDRVCAWLRAGGFAVNTVYPSGMSIDFSGTAGQVSAAFHTEVHRLSVNGQPHIANMSDPRIPEALAPVLTGIVSLNDFRPHAMMKPRIKPSPQYTVNGDGYTYQLVTPADLATIYDLNQAFAQYTGQGQTIAVLEDTTLFSTTDWNDFRTVLGLSTYTLGSLETVFPTPPSGVSNCTNPGVNPDDSEAAVDAEWATAAAPNATIELAACSSTNTTFGQIIAEANLINASDPPQIISMSYGFCEAGEGSSLNGMFNSLHQQAATAGISVFVSAGDEGAASCDAGFTTATHGIGVSGFASTPYNVAVGGTDFGDTYQNTSGTYWGATNSATYGSALSYVPEIPWNDSCASSLIADTFKFSVGYGPDGFCGSPDAQYGYYSVAAGSGGPSGCATGAPSEAFVVSGTCQGYPKPSWQSGVTGIANDGVRDLPDVSLFAGNGYWFHYYVVCFSDESEGGTSCAGPPDQWYGGGGTSFAAPILAGIQALVNQKMGAKQGNPNSVYYKLAAGSSAASVFHSITMGDIAVNCSGEINCFGAGFVGRGRATPVTPFGGNGALSTTSQSYTPAFGAGAGWNFATGLGSVDAFNLIMNWSSGQ